MKQFLRRLKLAYAVYNFFRRKSLLHNVPLLKKYGIAKKYYSPISSSDFNGLTQQQFITNPTLDVSNTAFFKETSSGNRESILAFPQNGFLIIRNYLPEET